MELIPKVGDVWEYKLPRHEKPIKKRVGAVIRHDIPYGECIGKKQVYRTRWFVYWDRQAKGRYTYVAVRILIKYGSRVSRMTNEEREAFRKRKAPSVPWLYLL